MDSLTYQPCKNKGSVGRVSVFALRWCGGSGWVVWSRVSCYVWILCGDGRSMYLCMVLGGYMHILGAPSVQSCCTLSISAS